MNPRDPRTPGEWQEAVDAASFNLHLDSAKQYGLIKTDIQVNVDRCDEIIRRGAEIGVRPQRIEALCKKFITRKSA